MQPRPKLSLAVVGAGLIGSRHIAQIFASDQARLAAVVDPTAVGAEIAARYNVPHLASLDALLEGPRPDGIILATPNALHVSQGLATIGAGLPTLIEKPIADRAADAQALVEAAEASGVPLLVGHHRRHNPLVAAAKSIIAEGRLGKVIAAHAMFWLRKPDPYFDVAWRREPGGGPLLINCIHDVDLLRHLLGEIDGVQAMQSSSERGFPVDETTVITLRFASGVLGTLSISDTIAAPWSWEHSASENRAFPRADQIFMQIGGTAGSLSLPRLEIWRHRGEQDWLNPLVSERLTLPEQDPLQRQIAQFCAVIRGEEPPLVSGRDALNTLRVVEAIAEAARTGSMVPVRST